MNDIHYLLGPKLIIVHGVGKIASAIARISTYTSSCKVLRFHGELKSGKQILGKQGIKNWSNFIIHQA